MCFSHRETLSDNTVGLCGPPLPRPPAPPPTRSRSLSLFGCMQHHFKRMNTEPCLWTVLSTMCVRSSHRAEKTHRGKTHPRKYRENDKGKLSGRMDCTKIHSRENIEGPKEGWLDTWLSSVLFTYTYPLHLRPSNLFPSFVCTCGWQVCWNEGSIHSLCSSSAFSHVYRIFTILIWLCTA